MEFPLPFWASGPLLGPYGLRGDVSIFIYSCMPIGQGLYIKLHLICPTFLKREDRMQQAMPLSVLTAMKRAG